MGVAFGLPAEYDCRAPFSFLIPFPEFAHILYSFNL